MTNNNDNERRIMPQAKLGFKKSVMSEDDLRILYKANEIRMNILMMVLMAKYTKPNESPETLINDPSGKPIMRLVDHDIFWQSPRSFNKPMPSPTARNFDKEYEVEASLCGVTNNE